MILPLLTDFLSRTNQTEFINYRGNMALNNNSTYKGKFFAWTGIKYFLKILRQI